jgi:hypothetical protein
LPIAVAIAVYDPQSAIGNRPRLWNSESAIARLQSRLRPGKPRSRGPGKNRMYDTTVTVKNKNKKTKLNDKIKNTNEIKNKMQNARKKKKQNSLRRPRVSTLMRNSEQWLLA